MFRSNKRNFEEQFEDAISDVDADVQKTCTMLHIVKNWKDDKEFGRQVCYSTIKFYLAVFRSISSIFTNY